MGDLARLRPTRTARTEELLAFIERELLFGQGCGMTDVSLLAATHLTPRARSWTLDKRLAPLAARLGVAWDEQDP